MMLFEEMAELQKEVCKRQRGADNEDNIVEEIADVLIMIKQLKMMEGITDNQIQCAIDNKVNRLCHRLEK